MELVPERGAHHHRESTGHRCDCMVYGCFENPRFVLGGLLSTVNASLIADWRGLVSQCNHTAESCFARHEEEVLRAEANAKRRSEEAEDRAKMPTFIGRKLGVVEEEALRQLALAKVHLRDLEVGRHAARPSHVEPTYRQTVEADLHWTVLKAEEEEAQNTYRQSRAKALQQLQAQAVAPGTPPWRRGVKDPAGAKLKSETIAKLTEAELQAVTDTSRDGIKVASIK